MNQTHDPSHAGAIPAQLEPSSNSSDAPAPASPFSLTSGGNFARRIITNFAVQNLRQAADALEADMPELARHHTAKAVENLQQLQTL